MILTPSRRFPPEAIYTIKEVAVLFGTTRRTIDRWIANGDLTAIKIGRRYITGRDLNRAIAKPRRKHKRFSMADQYAPNR